MTVDLYQTGVSGLISAQQQLATTGHNIANVNTEGFNRQRVEQTTLTASTFGQKFLGSGTLIKDISRVYNQFTYKEQLFNTTKLGFAKIADSSLTQLNDMMSQAGSALNGSLEKFYQAVNGIADNPSDTGLRSIAISQSEILSNDFRYLSENFAQLTQSSNIELTEIAAEISDISLELAQINEQVSSSFSKVNVGQPNDLLDKRDQLVTRLAEYTNVNTVTDTNGVMTVMIGGGSTLVAGITPLTLSVKSGDPDPLKTTLQLNGPNSVAELDIRSLGGALAAKLEFRDEHLAKAKSEVDRLALAIAGTVNDAQAQGLDLNEQQGVNFFTDINLATLQQSRVLSPATNNGNLSAQVEITDISLLPADEFEIAYDGANYVMTNASTGAAETLTLVSPGVYSSTQGFNFIENSGAAVAEDAFIIRPTANAASLIETTIGDPNAIAASSAVLVTPSENNVSSGSIEISEVYDPIAAQAAMDMTIEVLENPVGIFTYVVTDNTGTASASLPYNPPSQLIDLPIGAASPAFQIEIKGAPSGRPPFAPEVFTLTNAFGVGNSTNALNLALSQERGVINKGRETFAESLGITTAKVGSNASSAELVAETAEALHTQAFNRNQEISGVSLDEEAANLIKFQQAYQASSRIISVANTIFDTLFSVAR